MTVDSRVWTHEDGHRIRLLRADRLDRPTISDVELAGHGVLHYDEVKWLAGALVQALYVSELAAELAQDAS